MEMHVVISALGGSLICLCPTPPPPALLSLTKLKVDFCNSLLDDLSAEAAVILSCAP